MLDESWLSCRIASPPLDLEGNRGRGIGEGRSRGLAWVGSVGRSGDSDVPGVKHQRPHGKVFGTRGKERCHVVRDAAQMVSGRAKQT